MLGVVFSILHVKHFTFGRKVHIVTDHKPLITLFRKNLHATSPRLSHMLVQTLNYNIEFHHQEGTKRKKGKKESKHNSPVVSHQHRPRQPPDNETLFRVKIIKRYFYFSVSFLPCKLLYYCLGYLSCIHFPNINSV